MQKYTPYISKVLLTIVGMISLTTFYACSGGGSKKPDSTIVEGGKKVSEETCVANEDGSVSCEIPEGVSVKEDGTLDGTVFVGGENGVPLSEEDYEIKDGKIIIKNVEKLEGVIKGKDLDVCVMGADGECTSIGKVSVGVEEEKKEEEEKKDPEPGAILCQQTGCPEGQECGADGVCHNKADVPPPPPPPAGCLNPNNPCPAGQVCGADGTCQVVIAPPPPPPPPPPVECSVDGDCNDPAKKCSAQHCVAKVCGVDFQCQNTQSCQNNICVDDPTKMDSDGDEVKDANDQCPQTPDNPELGVDNKGCSKLEVNFVTTGNEKTEKLTNTKTGLVRINWEIAGSGIKDAYIYFTVPKPVIKPKDSDKSKAKADNAKQKKLKKKKKKGPKTGPGPKKTNPKAKKKGPKPGMMSLGGINGVGAEIDEDTVVNQADMVMENGPQNVGANAINNLAADDGSCDDLSVLIVDETGNVIAEDSLAEGIYGDFLDEDNIERCNAFNCHGFTGDPDAETMTCKIDLTDNLDGPFYHLLTVAHTPYTLVARGEDGQWKKVIHNMNFETVGIEDVNFEVQQTAAKLRVSFTRQNTREVAFSDVLGTQCSLESVNDQPDNEKNGSVFVNPTGETSFLCDLQPGKKDLKITAYGIVGYVQKKYTVNLGSLSISKFNEKGTMTCDQAGMGSDNCSGKYTLQWQLSRALTVTDKTNPENSVEKNASGSEKIWVQSVKVQAQRTDNGTWEDQSSCSNQQGMVDSNAVTTCQVDRNHNHVHWKIVVTDLDGEQVAPQTNSYPYVPYLESTPNSWQCNCSYNHTCTYLGFCGDDNECDHGGDWDCSTWGHAVSYTIKFVEFFKGKHLKEIKKIGDCPFSFNKQPPALNTDPSYQEPEYKLEGTVGERTFSCNFQGIGYDGSVHTISPNCNCSEHTW